MISLSYLFSETGASDNKCAETYHGPEAFSEIETQNVRDYVLALEPVPVLAQCLHSYSQLWLWPFGYENGGPYPENVDEIVRNFLLGFHQFFPTFFYAKSSLFFCKGFPDGFFVK